MTNVIASGEQTVKGKTALRSNTGHLKRRQHKRAEILARSRAIFLRLGYHATSMDALATEIAVSKPTLYKYFPSKEELFKNLMLAKTSEIRRSIQLSIQAHLTAREQLLNYAYAYAMQSLDEETMAMSRIVIGLAVEMPELSRFYYDLAHQVTTDTTTAFLQNLNDAGLLNIDDVELASDQFRALILTSYYGPLTYKPGERPDKDELEYIIEAGVDMFLKTYKNPINSVEKN